MQIQRTAVQTYLKQVLGIPVPLVQPWDGEAKLPYFLANTFQICQMDLLGNSVLLAFSRDSEKHSLADVRAQLDKVRAIAGQPIILCIDGLASYERKRLIEQKVPFLVPGNQLYLPELGVDLREYFRQRREPAGDTLSPATQAMLISVLLEKPWQSQWQPSLAATKLGYTPMTLSRSVKELVAADIAKAFTIGKSRFLKMERSALQTWEHAKPLLRNPVKRTLWVPEEFANASGPKLLAGLSALSAQSMLAEPKYATYAVGPNQWKLAKAAGVRELPEAEPGAREWQLWGYEPLPLATPNVVDPLSLILSLQGNNDERILLALDELKEQIQW